MVDLAESMRARSTGQLRLVCSRDAGDYTPEAIEAARAELVRRGEDVSGLVAATRAEPAGSSPANLIAVLVIVPLVIGLYVFRAELPFWLRLACGVVLGAGYLYVRALMWRKGRRRVWLGESDEQGKR